MKKINYYICVKHDLVFSNIPAFSYNFYSLNDVIFQMFLCDMLFTASFFY